MSPHPTGRLPEFTDHNGVLHPLGCLPPPTGLMLAPWMGAEALVPESDWIEFEDETPVACTDQNGYGACNGFAAAESVEEAEWVAGLPFVRLSGWQIYADLCGGVDRGSSIAEALQLLMTRGVCPDALVPYGTINPNRISAAARQAATHRIEIGNRLPQSFAALMSVVQRRGSANFSVCVGANFDQLDSDGVVGFTSGYGNHAISTALGAKRSRRDGRWLLKFRNHWRPSWGLNGFGWVDARHVERQSYFDAYPVLAVRTPDPDAPPVAA